MNFNKKLNLGCGYHFHRDWINIDFTSYDENVIAHNLLNGIPFNDNEFDVVYHSHVLEHFPKNKADDFIKECYRVLKKDGILRVVVPDLEAIARLYLEKLEKAYNGDASVEYDYDWIMLEMYDQTVRNQSGGEMLEYFKQEHINNLDFVISRIGAEAKNIINACKSLKEQVILENKPKEKFSFKKLFRKRKKVKEENLYEKIGKFRMGGEIHQWMYDRFSLKRLLERNGFRDIQIKNAYESAIEDWHKYQLDFVDGKIRKPDSLFMEARK